MPFGRLGDSDVERLYCRTARLRRLDDIMGGADTYAVYAAEVDNTARLIKNTTSGTRRLTALLAEQSQMAGWSAFDAGRHDVARRHYESSLQAAAEAGEHALAGNALCFLAYQMTATNADAIDTAEASYSAACDQATPRVKALLLERVAWAYAVAGQPGGTAAYLGRAREALHEPDDRREPDWVFWVDDDEVDIMTGRCWARLGQPRKAIPALAPALDRMSDTCARDKALYMTGLANAYVGRRPTRGSHSDRRERA